MSLKTSENHPDSQSSTHVRLIKINRTRRHEFNSLEVHFPFSLTNVHTNLKKKIEIKNVSGRVQCYQEQVLLMATLDVHDISTSIQTFIDLSGKVYTIYFKL